jgi:hypothetical protein
MRIFKKSDDQYQKASPAGEENSQCKEGRFDKQLWEAKVPRSPSELLM